MNVGYRRKIHIFGDVDWRMQINVRNLQNLGNRDLEVSRFQPDGSAARVRYGAPSEIFMTNTFTF